MCTYIHTCHKHRHRDTPPHRHTLIVSLSYEQVCPCVCVCVRVCSRRCLWCQILVCARIIYSYVCVEYRKMYLP